MTYIETTCDDVFRSVVGNEDKKIQKLITPLNRISYNFGDSRNFEIPKWNTNPFRLFFHVMSRE